MTWILYLACNLRSVPRSRRRSLTSRPLHKLPDTAPHHTPHHGGSIRCAASRVGVFESFDGVRVIAKNTHVDYVFFCRHFFVAWAFCGNASVCGWLLSVVSPLFEPISSLSFLGSWIYVVAGLILATPLSTIGGRTQ